jgi:hypothetical protein
MANRSLATEANVWDTVPKAAGHSGGDSSVTNDHFGAPNSTPLYVCHPPPMGLCWWYCLIPQFLLDWYGQEIYRKKNGEGFSWIQILSLRKTFLWNQATMLRFCYVRYCTLSRVWYYWQTKADGGCTTDQKMVTVHGSPCLPPPPPTSYWYWLSASCKSSEGTQSGGVCLNSKL